MCGNWKGKIFFSHKHLINSVPFFPLESYFPPILAICHQPVSHSCVILFLEYDLPCRSVCCSHGHGSLSFPDSVCPLRSCLSQLALSVGPQVRAACAALECVGILCPELSAGVDRRWGAGEQVETAWRCLIPLLYWKRMGAGSGWGVDTVMRL